MTITPEQLDRMAEWYAQDEARPRRRRTEAYNTGDPDDNAEFEAIIEAVNAGPKPSESRWSRLKRWAAALALTFSLMRAGLPVEDGYWAWQASEPVVEFVVVEPSEVEPLKVLP